MSVQTVGAAFLDRNVEAVSCPTDVVTVLSVSPFEEDHKSLQSIFDHSNWTLHRSFACREAVEFLKKNPTPVVVSESELADHCWKFMLDEIEHLALRPRPRLIVTSRLADDQLWSEVLNLGGYNVLEKPFERNEVCWVISHAWLDWRSENERRRHNQLARAAG